MSGRALALAAALVAAACDPRKAVVGRWEIVSVDGVAAAVAAPLRVSFPRVAYGADTLAAHGMWHEITLDSLALALAPDGTYTGRAVEATRTLARENTFARPAYVTGAFGGDLVRDEAQPAATGSAGSWTLAGDTVVLTEPRDRLVADLAARVRQAFPEVSAEAIEEALEQAVPGSPPPRWTGYLKGDRLELTDADGRRYVFRRAESGD